MHEIVPPKLIATDLDGTLLRSDLTISSFSRRVLRALEERSVHVVFVTARPPRWMKPVADAAGGHGRAICMNGACIYEFATGISTDVRGFDHNVLVSLISDLRRALPGITFAAERPAGAVFESEFAGSGTLDSSISIGSIETATDDVVGKLLARHPDLPDEEFFALVREVVHNRALLAYSGASGLAELTAPGVTKAAALARWATHHGISAHEVWAFGDMPNDVPMLSWAGRGIAVGNAHQQAKDAADWVSKSNDEDGLAYEVLRAFPDLLN